MPLITACHSNLVQPRPAPIGLSCAAHCSGKQWSKAPLSSACIVPTAFQQHVMRAGHEMCLVPKTTSKDSIASLAKFVPSHTIWHWFFQLAKPLLASKEWGKSFHPTKHFGEIVEWDYAGARRAAAHVVGWMCQSATGMESLQAGQRTPRISESGQAGVPPCASWRCPLSMPPLVRSAPPGRQGTAAAGKSKKQENAPPSRKVCTQHPTESSVVLLSAGCRGLVVCFV